MADKSTDYFLATEDVTRLYDERLNELYNTSSLDFLVKNGLKPGMTVLDYGCGSGLLTIEVAKYLGSSGLVIATDSNEDSIATTISNAQLHNIKNIKFHCIDVYNVDRLNYSFDLAFGRSVLASYYDPQRTLKKICDTLKPDGILVAEESNFKENGQFAYPHELALEKFCEILVRDANLQDLELNQAYQLGAIFKDLGLKEINSSINQPVLISSAEKSIYRLKLLSIESLIIKNNVLTEDELDEVIDEFRKIEGKQGIMGFTRNIQIKGVK